MSSIRDLEHLMLVDQARIRQLEDLVEKYEATLERQIGDEQRELVAEDRIARAKTILEQLLKITPKIFYHDRISQALAILEGK